MHTKSSLLILIMAVAMTHGQTSELRLRRGQIPQLLVSMMQQATPVVAAPDSTAPIFYIRQGAQQTPLTLHVREVVFVKTKSNDVADALKAEALSHAISLGATAAARKIANGVPYLGALAGRLPFGNNGKQQEWELDFLRGVTSEIEVKGSGIEFVIPPAAMIAGAAGATLEPMVVKLKRVEKDKVRIVAARKVTISPKAASPFGTADQEPFEREVLSSDFESVPIGVQKNADGTSLIKITSNLVPGEYALVFQKPEPKVFRTLDSVLDFKVTN